jgi:hypothetical protein
MVNLRTGLGMGFVAFGAAAPIRRVASRAGSKPAHFNQSDKKAGTPAGTCICVRRTAGAAYSGKTGRWPAAMGCQSA